MRYAFLAAIVIVVTALPRLASTYGISNDDEFGLLSATSQTDYATYRPRSSAADIFQYEKGQFFNAVTQGAAATKNFIVSIPQHLPH
ncbi:MAG: hypothetical protein JO029_10385 [Candidatus Eremiobacteraeota bacterium]|nr:hypothetical protein [Candidatus Eremiobacteraeota bacterium]MBV8333094.1 hypothetical protein [Candidatus Eremiobacteraeota bacterium]MBV8434674.1 hypothetical protein [Candidatus Eremiobacteraeota bacterium]MBV8655797.1 hypothetical protein [Candidatus Eremiobacteraeota bacterium]MBV8722682.1 hypothetical protein [Candidatus Eremiobacteraeota bacterium]